MKKLLALLIVLTMIIGIMPVVSAAIPLNNGLGTVQSFSSWERNSPSSGTWIGSYTLTDDPTFGDVYRHITTGSTASKSYTAYKGFLKFDKTDDVTITSGDKVFISFYYRVNTSVDGEAYATPKALYASTSICQNTSTGTKLDISETDTWKYHSAIKTVYSSIASNSANADKGIPANIEVRQYTGIYTHNATDKVCVDIAEPTMIYLGAVTDEDDATANEQIASTLSTTTITGVTVGGTTVDLTANPTSYTTEEAVAASDVTVTTTHGTADKVIVEDGENKVTVKVYAPYIDWRASGATPTATYTINVEEPEPEYVTVTENNGYGTGVIMGTETPTVVGSVGRKYGKLETITGTDAAPFDEYYSWTREAFTEEDTSTQSYLALNGDLTGGASEGDWVYVSFYYRTYNRFTNSAGVVVDNNQIDIFPAIRSDSGDSPCYRPGTTARYIRLIPDTTAESDVGEWQKITYIQKLDKATNESWTLKLANGHTNNDDGTITGKNRKIDFADIKVVYFGVPEGNTTDEDVIKAAIEEAAGNYGLTNVYLNGEEIDTVSNPLSYSFSAPRYTAREKVADITGNSIHGDGTVSVYENDGTYVVKSYPLDYDFLSGTDTRVASYTINETIEYDFYDFALNGNTFTLKGDNGLSAPKTGVIIGVSYNANGKMLKLKAEPFSITGKANPLSVTVPESDETVASMKFFIWDGVATSVPFVKTITISDLTDGTITQ